MDQPAAPQAEVAPERPSLSDTLSAAFDEAKVDAPVVDAPATGSSSEPVKAADAPKVDATGRAHAPDGKFASKDAPAQATPQAGVPPVTTPVAGAPARPKRPDSWAKEHWDAWEKLDPSLADYLHKRETQYLQGVTTYKQEYERVKPIAEALQPYQNLIQSSGGAPQFIKALADTHTVLSGQDPQAKLKAFARFAKDYQIPLEQLLVQGDDGKVYLNQQFFADQPAPQQAMGPQEIDKIVQQRMAIERLNTMVQQFASEKGADGKPARPHFETVKGTMDGLLRSGLAQNLQDAYDAALRLPKHADIAEADRLQRETDAKAADEKAKADAAQRARANMVSPRNQAPTALVSAASGKKGLRAALEDAANASLGGGRV